MVGVQVVGTTKAGPRTGPVKVARVFARIALAAVGGYTIAALATALLSAALPLERSEAVTTATLVSFAIIAGVVVFVFALRSVRRAAAILLVMILALAASLWLAVSSALTAGGAL